VFLAGGWVDKWADVWVGGRMHEINANAISCCPETENTNIIVSVVIFSRCNLRIKETQTQC